MCCTDFRSPMESRPARSFLLGALRAFCANLQALPSSNAVQALFLCLSCSLPLIRSDFRDVFKCASEGGLKLNERILFSILTFSIRVGELLYISILEYVKSKLRVRLPEHTSRHPVGALASLEGGRISQGSCPPNHG